MIHLKYIQIYTSKKMSEKADFSPEPPEENSAWPKLLFHPEGGTQPHRAHWTSDLQNCELVMLQRLW